MVIKVWNSESIMPQCSFVAEVSL